MVYSFNLGIGWASSGVEYAQLYRARMFRQLGIDARFVFTDMFPSENIEHLTRRMGFADGEIVWLYTAFTDFHTAPVSYTIDRFVASLAGTDFRISRTGRKGRIVSSTEDAYWTVYFTDDEHDLVHRVEYVFKGRLVRKDYFTYGRIYSEYYAPLDGRAHLYLRRFFNEDGTVAFEEMPDGAHPIFRFPDAIFYSKQELVAHLMQRLGLTAGDTVLIDRTTGIGQAVLAHAAPARVGVVVHADHWNRQGTNSTHILWNNYYEYAFDMQRHIDFFVASTEAQKRLMEEQFARYTGRVPKICVIPVGSIDAPVHPKGPRRPFSVVTASRLAPEKHIGWAIEACAKAKERVPELVFDICGEGSERPRLEKLIESLDASFYVHLLGQKDMGAIYPSHELYLSASTSEGFGLSLMEAVGAGLAMKGFDVPYGNPTFIDDGKNGYLVPVYDGMEESVRTEALANRIVRYFLEDDRPAFERRSYELAEDYLTERVALKWKSAVAAG